MTDFLNSTILPGENIPKHEHRRMLVVLLIVIIVAVIIGLGIWFKVFEYVVFVDNTKNTDVEVDLVLQDLQNSVVDLSLQEKIDSVRDLERSVIQLTDKQKEDRLADLTKSAK